MKSEIFLWFIYQIHDLFIIMHPQSLEWYVSYSRLPVSICWMNVWMNKWLEAGRTSILVLTLPLARDLNQATFLFLGSVSEVTKDDNCSKRSCPFVLYYNSSVNIYTLSINYLKYLFIYSFICPSSHPSIHLPIHLFNYPSLHSTFLECWLCAKASKT